MTSLPGRLLDCREFGGGGRREELIEALNSGWTTNWVLLSLVRPCWPCSTSCHSSDDRIMGFEVKLLDLSSTSRGFSFTF